MNSSERYKRCEGFIAFRHRTITDSLPGSHTVACDSADLSPITVALISRVICTGTDKRNHSKLFFCSVFNSPHGLGVTRHRHEINTSDCWVTQRLPRQHHSDAAHKPETRTSPSRPPPLAISHPPLSLYKHNTNTKLQEAPALSTTGEGVPHSTTPLLPVPNSQRVLKTPQTSCRVRRRPSHRLGQKQSISCQTRRRPSHRHGPRAAAPRARPSLRNSKASCRGQPRPRASARRRSGEFPQGRRRCRRR
jgi:hypothetical protein